MTRERTPSYEQFYKRAGEVRDENEDQRIADVISRDPGVVFEPHNVERLARLRQTDLPAYQTARADFKRWGVDVFTLDKAGAKVMANGAAANPITAIASNDLLSMQIPPREIFLSPWIAAQSISMVFANRGTGKTFLLMSTALALASGTSFLGWSATAPRKVAYVEGELPLASLQDRCRMLGSHPNLTIVNPEL